MFTLRTLLGVAVGLSSCIFAHAQACYNLLDKPSHQCPNSECSEFCALSVTTALWNDLIPGFSTGQRSGQISVMTVVPRSPAELADVRVGDELLSIDGISAPFNGGEAPNWQDGAPHSVVLRRGEIVLSKEMKGVSTEALVASLPRISEALTPAALSVNRIEPLRPAPFMSGLKVHREGVDLVVDAIVIGSPALQEGILPGDVLVNSGATPGQIEYSSYRRVLYLTVKHGMTIREVNLTLASLTDIFNGARAIKIK